MQPTTDEIQREMDSIRSMRRISSQSGPGSLTLDPDLPPQSSSGASLSPSTATRQSPTSPYANLPGIAALSLPGTCPSFCPVADPALTIYLFVISYFVRSITGTTATGELISPTVGEDDTIVPSNGEFFWVPASLHPELAPSEFKAFLRDHRRDVEEGSDDSPAALGRVGSIGLQRSGSGLSRSGSGLGRKKSMLSRQYTPRGSDADEDGPVKPMKRNRSSVYANAAPQLTIKDLQKLDDLADAAAAGNGSEASLIRSQLRRSISLGFMGSIIDHIDGVKEEEEEDSPVIVPSKALQRTARTRIRKPGLEGDGGGHRFANTRRGGKRTKTLDSSMHMPSLFEDEYSRPTSDLTTSDHASLSDQEGEPYARPQAPSPDQLDAERARPRFATEEEERPVSMGESIYDAYGGDQDKDSVYYDARESGSFDKAERVTSGDSFEMVTGAGARNGVVYDTGEDGEPFFAGAGAGAHTGRPSTDQKGYSGPTVILHQKSPEPAPEQLPLTQPGSQRATPPSIIEIPPSHYAQQQQQQQQQYPNHISTPSSNPSFVKEYGYQQQYGQPLPPSQMYRDQNAGVVHQPSPKRHLDVPLTGQPGVSPPSSPELIRSPSISPSAEAPYGRPFSAPPSTSGRPSSAEKKAEKEKEKGKGWGLFGRGGKDKEKEKEKEREKEKEKERREKEMSKKNKKEKPEGKATPKEEKEGGGGLFGIFGGKKKHEGDSSSAHSHTSSNQSHAPGAKIVTAKNQLLPFTTASPALTGQYARYPLHVERAVYRLSHIKLANPRRPLYEQVLISNLMFWYLGIINKPTTPTTPPSEAGKLPATGEGGAGAQPVVNGNGQPIMSTSMSPAQQAALAQQAAAAAAAEKARLEAERVEKEQREKEDREREVKETQERERLEREQREKERIEKEREQTKLSKKSGLTKAERDRSKKAETAVKPPNYGVQSRAMEQDYTWDRDSQAGGGRPSISPASPRAAPASSQHTAYHLPVRAQQRPMPVTSNGPQQPYFHQQDMSQVVYQPPNPYALPPGAKPPASVENNWAVTSNAAAAASANDSKHRRSPPPTSQPYYEYSNVPAGSNSTDRPRPTRSPPPHDYLTAGMSNGARPARSLSANARDRPPGSSGPTASGTFPPSPASSGARPVEYERPAHNYSQSASAVVGQTNGVPAQPAASARLQKKKSAANVDNAPSETTKPPARRRKSIEAGGGDRRGVVEPDVSFESMWQQQYPAGGYSQYNGNQQQYPAQQAQMQGQQGWAGGSYR